MDLVTATETSPTTEDADPVVVAERLRMAATRLARRLRQESDSGLTPSQTAALATVGGRGPLPLGALADEERISASTASKVVDKLVAAGLVERRPDPDDRRVAQISITREGRQVHDTVRARKTAWLARRLADLPADDLARLGAAVDVLEHLTTVDEGGRP